jgi:hypothetical protein
MASFFSKPNQNKHSTVLAVFYLQASVVRQMKDSEMAMQWTLIYQLTSRLRVLLQSAPSKRLLFEYSATSQD